MNPEGPRNCWEFWCCEEEIREKCDAYLMRYGDGCWTVAGLREANAETCPRITHGIRDCWECVWFQKLNPNIHKRAN